jgi:SAM-dependent methyltransferase
MEGVRDMEGPYREIWRMINHLRQSGTQADIDALVRMARDQGFSVDMGQMQEIVREYEFTVHGPSDELVNSFILSYLEESSPDAVLDIWVGIGQLLAPLVEALKPKVAIGLTRYANEYEGAPYLNPGVPIEWKLGNQLSLLDDLDTEFDAVVGSPPWNWRTDTLLFDSDDGVISVRDYTGNLMILKASMLLKPGGTGLFVVPQSFTGVVRNQNVRASMARLGLFLHAALTLPGGHFEPVTSLPGLLIVIRRQRPEQLFVGELSPRSSNTLLKNLKSRKEGKVPQLGAFVDGTAFKTLPALLAERELESAARSLGFPPVLLSNIAAEINLENRRIEDGFENKPNSVYLPLIGHSLAVASLADTFKNGDCCG